MEVVINKVELKKFINRYYFRIELIDYDGKTYVLNKPFLSDTINFRKQVFGIMSAIGSYDLMRFTTDNPNCKGVTGYYFRSLEVLENEKHEWLTYDKEREEYVCRKADNSKKALFDSLIERKMFIGSVEEGKIRSILSQSGVFQLLFFGKESSTFYTTNQLYYGFGYPLDIGFEDNISDTEKSAQNFVSFIVSLMKFYGIKDLLHFGGNIERLPVVEMTLNNNEIVSITNSDTGIGLFVTNKQYVVDRKAFEKVKVKK